MTDSSLPAAFFSYRLNVSSGRFPCFERLLGWGIVQPSGERGTFPSFRSLSRPGPPCPDVLCESVGELRLVRASGKLSVLLPCPSGSRETEIQVELRSCLFFLWSPRGPPEAHPLRNPSTGHSKELLLTCSGGHHRPPPGLLGWRCGVREPTSGAALRCESSQEHVLCLSPCLSPKRSSEEGGQGTHLDRWPQVAQ